ncbi:hypothetical protein HMPREF0185_01110 [Brevundimonas diminuta 470-4]|nr:hypothetical protein HMPREF0185_01110 [Brevundimonas diminuta 470-4]
MELACILPGKLAHEIKLSRRFNAGQPPRRPASEFSREAEFYLIASSMTLSPSRLAATAPLRTTVSPPWAESRSTRAYGRGALAIAALDGQSIGPSTLP